MKFNTNNFKLSEWATNKYRMVYPTEKKIKLMEGLEEYKIAVANEYGVEISDVLCIITNGDRIYTNGSSQHEYGIAADVWTRIPKLNKILSSEEQMKIVERMNLFTGRGLYPYDKGFIHVDVRRGLYPSKTGNRISRWYRDSEGEYHTCEDGTFEGNL